MLEESQAPPPGGISSTQFGRVDDVHPTIAAVEGAGGRPLSPPARRSWGEDAASFADPDGNVVGVAQQ